MGNSPGVGFPCAHAKVKSRLKEIELAKANGKAAVKGEE
jgi:hypothetical protein